MSKPQIAGTSEILRASQKDEEYLHYLRNLISDVTQRCLGLTLFVLFNYKWFFFPPVLYVMVTWVYSFN